jgi:uncharacterized protein YdaU (DUF1376 family)
MTKAPAFQFYAADYLADETVGLMTLAEEGAYIRLLSYCWREGSIPADPILLSRLCKGADNQIITVVIKCFKQSVSEPSRMIHERLEKERAKQAAWSEKSREGGKKGMERRWHGQNNNGEITTPITVVKPNDNIASSSSSSSSDTDKTTAHAVAKSDAPASPTTKAAALSDDEWLTGLESDPAYQGIPVRIEYGKCRAWCEVNRKQLSRRRFVNWLNRAERPLNAAAGKSGAPPLRGKIEGSQW